MSVERILDEYLMLLYPRVDTLYM